MIYDMRPTAMLPGSSRPPSAANHTLTLPTSCLIGQQSHGVLALLIYRISNLFEWLSVLLHYLMSYTLFHSVLSFYQESKCCEMYSTFFLCHICSVCWVFFGWAILSMVHYAMGKPHRLLAHHSDWLKARCHEFRRSRSLSLFGRRSAVDFTGLLAIADSLFIFHLFCLCLTHLVSIQFII